MSNPIPCIAKVALLKQIGEPLDYTIPDHFQKALMPGMRVLVPFRNQQRTGIVVELTDQPEVFRVKPILEILDEHPIVDPPLLLLTREISNYYLSSWGVAIRCALPPGLDITPKILYRLTEAGKMAQSSFDRIPRIQLALIKAMARSKNGLTTRVLSKRVQTRSITSALHALTQKEWVERIYLFSGPKRKAKPKTARPSPEDQQSSLPFSLDSEEDLHKALYDAIDSRRFEVFNYQGVLQEQSLALLTSIGKKTLIQGKQLLVLAPEVSQVEAMADELASALKEEVAVYHGELTPAARVVTWDKISRGNYSVTVGTRTAVFSPMKSLGLIIVMQEEDSAYKAEEAPHYHARDVAVLRAKLNHIPVVLTSVLPSVDTYFKVQSGEYRVVKHDLPFQQLSVSIENMNRLPPGQFLSDRLSKAIEEQLQINQPVLLLLNRRGYSTAMLCRECGFIFRCDRCGVTLIFHRQVHQLTCHYCGTGQPPPTDCPSCKGSRIGGIGMGTEQGEESLRRLFPPARILRVDRDSHPSPTKKADIYLGTEWVYRWTASLKVSLVGILDADTSLYAPDFHASERTFLFTAHVLSKTLAFQAKSPLPKVIIQTRYPEHASIAWAQEGHSDLFYSSELLERKSLGYPPFSRLVAIIVTSIDLSRASRKIETLARLLREALPDQSGVQVLGPVAAPITPLRGRHRFLLLVKGPLDRGSPQDMIRTLLASQPHHRWLDGEVRIIVDPLRIR